MNVIKTIHYCKADKKTGKPVVITDKDGNMKNVKKWVWQGLDHSGKAVRFEIEFNNSKGKAKKSGATTVLKVYS